MKHRLISVTGAVGLLAAASLALAACSTGGGGGTGGSDSGAEGGAASGEPIKVGAVASLSGSSAFPEATQAAQAVFDRFNEEGGLDGRPIEYTVIDDKADPETSSSAARDLVGDGAVAMVGSSSLLECQINAGFYEEEGIVSIEGVAVDPQCFDSPVIAPTVVGPYGDTELSLTYGSEELGLERICAIIETAGSTAPAYDEAVKRWSEATGKELAFYDSSLPYGLGDYTPYAVKVKDQNCDGVLVGMIEPDALGFLKAAKAQGLEDVTFLSLTTVYTEAFAEAAGGMVGDGLYVPAEFAPFNEESEETADWRELMEANDIPLTSFGQAGYLAATFFLEGLQGIDGDVTRESVKEALTTMPPVENPMIGNPWEFGNTPNRSGWPVVLKSGETVWAKAADDWIHLPE
ncbi:MAG: ABC transporter substrate-binding protein [Leucobacter sp.]